MATISESLIRPAVMPVFTTVDVLGSSNVPASVPSTETKKAYGLSDFFRDILPGAAARASYELAAPAIKRTGAEGMLGKVGTVGIEVGLSQNMKLALGAAAMVALLVVVLIVIGRRKK